LQAKHKRGRRRRRGGKRVYKPNPIKVVLRPPSSSFFSFEVVILAFSPCFKYVPDGSQ
jgi:hypothetical protein